MARPLFSTVRWVILLALVAATIASRPADPAAQAPVWQAKVDSWVLETAEQGETEFLVMLQEQADLSDAGQLRTKAEKGEYVYQLLTRTAERTQKPVLQALETLSAESSAELEYRPFWVANMIWVRGGSQVVQALAQRRDVAHLYANPNIAMDPPLPAIVPHAPAGTDATIIEASIQKIHAPEVWAMGYTGQGVVIGGQDTGYDWDHPALQGKYRGWNGATADHNYNWHDAIHSGGGVCGPNSLVPCDDDYHGTHTMGTMVGEGVDTEGDLRQFGVAPGAKWIGCRNMNQGVGKASTYIECYQWFIAPTDLYGGNPRTDLAPDIINNSWSCPPGEEGCDFSDQADQDDLLALMVVVNNVRAAGILTVHSAGNTYGCYRISTPGAIYDASFTVGATDSNDNIASFSSSGPVTVDGSNRLKPDVSAPGLNIFSTIPGGGFRYASGTSMAAPHVAGVAALLLSARPDLRGQVDQIEDLIRHGAVPRTTSLKCGEVFGNQIPNNTYGWGRVDALASLANSLLAVQKEPSSIFFDPGEMITYTLRVTNHRTLEVQHNVRITDTIPANTTFINATLPYTLTGDQITWNIPELGPGQNQSLELVVQVPPDANEPIVNQDYAASSDEAPIATGPPVWVYYLANPVYYPIILLEFSSPTEPVQSP